MACRLPSSLEDSGLPDLGLSNLSNDFFRDFEQGGSESFLSFGRADVQEENNEGKTHWKPRSTETHR